MKITNITEATEVNMKLLQELTNIILKNFPEKIEKESEYIIDFENIISDLKPLLKKYKEDKYKQIIIRTASANILLSNYVDNSFKAQGSYNYNKNKIYINLAGIANNALEWNQTMISKSIKLRTTLIHELRHLAQFTEYPKAAIADMQVDLTNVSDDDEIKDKLNKAYNKRKIEIDAAWHHMLDESNPLNYNTPNKYATRVMDQLSFYKDLTEKQYAHYKNKTIRYYYFINRSRDLENIESYVDSIFSDKKYNSIKEAIRDTIDFYFGENFDYDNASPLEQKEYKDVRTAVVNKFKSINQLR